MCQTVITKYNPLLGYEEKRKRGKEDHCQEYKPPLCLKEEELPETKQ